jgi:hypothetical protein
VENREGVPIVHSSAQPVLFVTESTHGNPQKVITLSRKVEECAALTAGSYSKSPNMTW